MGKNSEGPRQRKRSGPRPKFTPKELETLYELVRQDPVIALDDLVAMMRRLTGKTVSAPTIGKYLEQAGFKRVRGGRKAKRPPTESEPSSSLPKEYGYREGHRDRGDEIRYPCGLTDSEWEHVRHLFENDGKAGRPSKYPRRQMLDACIYVLRSGCSWRMLPKDFPQWDAVYRTFRRWAARGLFEAMQDELRVLWRSRLHRTPDPSAAVLDSQSVSTTAQGGPKGYDAAKKVKGRKRHLVTDTGGLLLAVLVTAGSVQDRDAAVPAMDLAMTKVPGLQMLYVDSGYGGQVAEDLRSRHQIKVQVVRHPANSKVGQWYEGQLPLFETPKGFMVLPKRWVIERTNAWNDRPRRMNKDHDRSLEASTAWIWLNQARMLLRRLITPAEGQLA